MKFNHSPSLCQGKTSRRNRCRDWEDSCYGWVFSLLSCVVLTYGCSHLPTGGSTHSELSPPRNNHQSRQLPQACPQANLMETISQLSQDENKTQLKYPITCQIDTQTHHCKIITIFFLIVSKILCLYFTYNAIELYTSQLSLKIPKLSVENGGRQF